MNIYEKLLAIESEIATVAKNLTVQLNKSNSYKAVGEVDVINAVKPLEKKYGVYSYPFKREIVGTEVFTKTYKGNDGSTSETNTLFMRIKTIYRFVNIEKPDEFVDVETYGDGVDTQDKACGKAMTYADKYALLKAYKIATGDDPDQNGSQDMGSRNKGASTKTATNGTQGVKTQSNASVDEARNFVINFGKHSGKTLGELPQDYLEWLVDKAQNAQIKQYAEIVLKSMDGVFDELEEISDEDMPF